MSFFPDLRRSKIYVGSVIHRGVEPFHMKSLVYLLRDAHYGYFPEVGDALVERARGTSATHFLRHTDAEVHLSLDSDIVDFEKTAIDVMCEQAVKYGIVGGVYICKSVARTYPSTLLEEGQRVMFANDQTPVPVKWIATGCVAVHRRVFEAMAETMPLLHATDGIRAFYNFYHSMEYDVGGETGKILLSEDYAFSERAKALGFTSYINPAIRMGHVGPYVYRLEDMASDYLVNQPLALTRVDRYWHVECEGKKATPEEMGRLPEGKGKEIRDLFLVQAGRQTDPPPTDGRGARRRRAKKEKKEKAHV